MLPNIHQDVPPKIGQVCDVEKGCLNQCSKEGGRDQVKHRQGVRHPVVDAVSNTGKQTVMDGFEQSFSSRWKWIRAS